MNFSKKIGFSFLALTLLTVLIGCIGLLFVYRVLSVLGSVPDSEGPLVRNLEELNGYLKKTVAISREVSPELEVEDLLQLRRDVNRVATEFDRTFREIRRGVEDEISLGKIEQFGQEHGQLRQQTQALITAIIDELQVEKKVNEQLARSLSSWRQVMEVLGALTAGAVPPQPGIFGAEGSALSVEFPALIPEPDRERFLGVFVRLQHLLMALRLELNQYFSLQELDALPGQERKVRALFSEASSLLESLPLAPIAEPSSVSLEVVRTRFVAWRDIFTQAEGAMSTYRQGIQLKQRTDQLSGAMQTEADDTLRVLDSMVAIRNRLIAGESGRGFVTAAPTLLVVTIVAATVISALMGVLLTRTITRPVRQLIAATEVVGRGDYSHRVRISSGDELAQLGGSFNRMIEEINRAQEEVRAVNATLEQRVRDRTAELEDEIGVRKKAEQSLRASEDRYRTLVDNFPRGVIALLDRSLRFIAIGGEGIRSTGASSSTILERGLEEVCPPELAAQLRPPLLAAFAGEKQELELRFAERDWQITVVPTPLDRREEPGTITVLALDVTEAKRIAEQVKQKQQQLIQADKLASLGVLVAGVAHEINNPNQAIMMGGQLLRKAWPGMQRVLDAYYRENGDFLLGGTGYAELRESFAEHVEGIVSSAKRIENIVRGLKDFARQDRADMSQLVNLNVVVKSALILLSNMLKKATDHLVVELSPHIPAFRGNGQQIEQVVINLVQNACQALGDRREEVAISTAFDPDTERVILEVRDQGAGIAGEDLSRIMDPFFTTKRESGGTGLGLSVSSTIVQEHGGLLEISSAVGEGTVARATFPTRVFGKGRAPS
jgi:signal transduction histidine kinase